MYCITNKVDTLPQTDVDLMSSLHQYIEVIVEFSSHFNVLFRRNFNGRKIDVASTYFFDVILINKKLTYKKIMHV